MSLLLRHNQSSSSSSSSSSLKGCDTFVVYPPSTANGVVIFGKNSDRPAGEGQSMVTYPACDYDAGSIVQCTYISIPQTSHTYAVYLSKIDWMWGCEHGANECGVVIGNEAVWTRIPEEESSSTNPLLLLGMDLVRLGLERGNTSKDALKIITNLLETHGQGGPCAENDPSFTYHNSFLIADYNEAYILETAGRHWVAQRWTQGGRNISNGLTIRQNFDMSSKGIQQYAKDNGLWNGITEPFDFAAIFSSDGIDEDPDSRQSCGKAMLEKFSNSETFSRKNMISILQDHNSGICMHGSFETTASMVSELYPNLENTTHWTTGPYPCKNTYKKFNFHSKDTKVNKGDS